MSIINRDGSCRAYVSTRITKHLTDGATPVVRDISGVANMMTPEIFWSNLQNSDFGSLKETHLEMIRGGIFRGFPVLPGTIKYELMFRSRQLYYLISRFLYKKIWPKFAYKLKQEILASMKYGSPEEDMLNLAEAKLGIKTARDAGQGNIADMYRRAINRHKACLFFDRMKLPYLDKDGLQTAIKRSYCKKPWIPMLEICDIKLLPTYMYDKFNIGKIPHALMEETNNHKSPTALIKPCYMSARDIYSTHKDFGFGFLGFYKIPGKDRIYYVGELDPVSTVEMESVKSFEEAAAEYLDSEDKKLRGNVSMTKSDYLNAKTNSKIFDSNITSNLQIPTLVQTANGLVMDDEATIDFESNDLTDGAENESSEGWNF